MHAEKNTHVILDKIYLMHSNFYGLHTSGFFQCRSSVWKYVFSPARMCHGNIYSLTHRGSFLEDSSLFLQRLQYTEMLDTGEF